MLSRLKYIRQGISEVIFPHVCKICARQLSQSRYYVCPACLQEGFEIANPEGKMSSSDTILPEGVSMQHALWKFDKGGHLQDLLHALKYQRLTGIGEDLGWALGSNLMNHPYYHKITNGVLIPVPLHTSKKRKRGYNQARFIAQGIRSVTRIPVIEEGVVVRMKNTRTQTGFSLEKRRKNMQKAFRVEKPGMIKAEPCIIVDDVFTTGATTFELAGTLLEAGARNIMIITVAEA